MEVWNIVVPAISSLIGLVFGYFFGKWDSERKRKWEVEDRELDSRTKVRDANIDEARIYLDTYWNVAQTLSINELFLGAGVEDAIIKKQENHVFNTMLENKKRMANIYSLDDADFNLHLGILNAVFSAEHEARDDLKNLIAEGKSIDHDAVIERVGLFNQVMLNTLTRMKMRLNELAQEVP